MLFSIVDLLLCLMCLARAARKIYVAVLQVSSGSYLEATVCMIESGYLLWSERRRLQIIGGYLAKKSYRALVECRNWVIRSKDRKDDVD